MIIHSLRDSISIFPNLIQLKSVWKYSRPSFFPSNGEEITRAKRDKSYQWHTTMHVNTEHVRVISFLFSPGGWRNLFATIRFYDSKFKSRDRRESRAAASMMRRTNSSSNLLLPSPSTVQRNEAFVSLNLVCPTRRGLTIFKRKKRIIVKYTFVNRDR